MAESKSQHRRGPGDYDDGELIQFGGLPDRWPFQRLKTNRASVAIGLATLAVGLLIGFFGGRLTARQADHKLRSSQPVTIPIIVPRLATPAIAMTGQRCAVQVGNNLQLGVEIMNQGHYTVTLSAIRPMFPLGGLRTISTGTGTCGALPVAQIFAPASLSPGATEWIYTTVAVRLACPEPLPVWFKVRYTSAGKTGAVVLAGFPDLGPVSYRHCETNQNTSAIIANVENGTNH